MLIFSTTFYIYELNKSLDEKNIVIQSQKKLINNQEQTISTLNQNIEEKTQIIGSLQENIYTKEEHISTLEKQILLQSEQMKIQNIQIENQRNTIEEEKTNQQVMNEDKDIDGLTYQEEIKLGTSDNDSDSDDDGVPDKYDEHPTGGGRNTVKYLQWSYLEDWNWELTIPADVISYYEQIRPTWQGDYSKYYSEFIDSKDVGIQQMALGLKNIIDKKKNQWTYYDEVMFIVRLVQALHYSSDELVGFDDYPKYPMQTINDGTGDCEDMAILAAALLKELNYDVILIKLSNIPGSSSNHLAIGVLGTYIDKGTYIEKNGKPYFYIETTSSRKFGEFPEQFKGCTFELIDIQ